jgi:chromosome partitioning protein|tara:strand:+ start:233 stop:1036 length:804 start_codon:yes stop_codon:yes gene_type:complete
MAVPLNKVVQCIAFVNQKGGVGKTTTAVSLAAALAYDKKRVLVIDLDPQANATSASGFLDHSGPTIYESLSGEVEISSCIYEAEDGFYLIPSTPDLAGLEVELVNAVAREQRLKKIIEPLVSEYDWIFIDCPPSLSVLTVNALTAAEGVIVPVQCEYLALEGLSRLTETIALIREHLNSKLKIIGVLLTMFDSRTRLAHQVEKDVRDHFPQTFQTIIPRSIRLGEAPSHGRSILSYAPSSKAATAYLNLAIELQARMEDPNEFGTTR